MADLSAVRWYWQSPNGTGGFIRNIECDDSVLFIDEPNDALRCAFLWAMNGSSAISLNRPYVWHMCRFALIIRSAGRVVEFNRMWHGCELSYGVWNAPDQHCGDWNRVDMTKGELNLCVFFFFLIYLRRNQISITSCYSKCKTVIFIWLKIYGCHRAPTF